MNHSGDGREGGCHACGTEDHEPGDEHRASSDAIGGQARRQEQCCERECVGVDDPGQLRLVGAQILRDVRQRDRQCGVAGDDECERCAQRDQQSPQLTIRECAETSLARSSRTHRDCTPLQDRRLGQVRTRFGDLEDHRVTCRADGSDVLVGPDRDRARSARAETPVQLAVRIDQDGHAGGRGMIDSDRHDVEHGHPATLSVLGQCGEPLVDAVGRHPIAGEEQQHGLCATQMIMEPGLLRGRSRVSRGHPGCGRRRADRASCRTGRGHGT